MEPKSAGISPQNAYAYVLLGSLINPGTPQRDILNIERSKPKATDPSRPRIRWCGVGFANYCIIPLKNPKE